MDDRFRNADGTYDGVGMMAAISGLSRDEIRWTIDRMKQLLSEGRTTDEAKAILKSEAKDRLWEKKDGR